MVVDWGARHGGRIGRFMSGKPRPKCKMIAQRFKDAAVRMFPAATGVVCAAVPALTACLLGQQKEKPQVVGASCGRSPYWAGAYEFFVLLRKTAGQDQLHLGL